MSEKTEFYKEGTIFYVIQLKRKCYKYLRKWIICDNWNIYKKYIMPQLYNNISDLTSYNQISRQFWIVGYHTFQYFSRISFERHFRLYDDSYKVQTFSYIFDENRFSMKVQRLSKKMCEIVRKITQ